MPTVPAVKAPGTVEIAGGVALAAIVILKATDADVPVLFEAVTSKVYAPAVVGVPEITPEALIERPKGSTPETSAQDVGELSAVSVLL